MDGDEYFTVVQWGQRGAGKTYLLSDPATIALTLTRERMIADTEQIAEIPPRFSTKPFTGTSQELVTGA